MKYYVAIRGRRVVANWGGENPPLSESQLAESWPGSAPTEIREIPTSRPVPIGWLLSCYTADWRLKSTRQLAAEGLDENGETPPTAAEIQAKADHKANIDKLKAEIVRLERWVAFDFEREQLKPVSEKIADKVWNSSDQMAKQRKVTQKEAATALQNLKAAHVNLIKKWKEGRTQYAARLPKARAELAKLEKTGA